MGREIVLFLKFLWPTDKKRVNIGLRCPHASSRTRRPELETQGRGFEARPRFVDSSSSSGIPKTKKNKKQTETSRALRTRTLIAWNEVSLSTRSSLANLWGSA